MRISDWSSDVCSSDLLAGGGALDRDGYFVAPTVVRDLPDTARLVREEQFGPAIPVLAYDTIEDVISRANDSEYGLRSEEHTSELQSLMRHSYDVFCLQKTKAEQTPDARTGEDTRQPTSL